MQPFIIFPLASAFVFLVLRQLGRRRSNLPLPPGPRGLPLVGNLRDIAGIGGDPWVTYNQWSQVYGDVLHFKVLGHHTVVLNSYEATNDLLDKKSYNYSDRPGESTRPLEFLGTCRILTISQIDMPMFIDLMRFGWNFAVMRYSDQWRLHRRTFNQFFQSRVISQYNDIQRAATVKLMQNLEASPEDFFQHVKHQSGSILLKIVYGYTLQAKDDPYLELFHEAQEGIGAAAIIGSFWIDYFPVLKYLPSWLPGTSFKRKAKVWKQQLIDMKEKPWGWLIQATEHGTGEASFATRSIDRLSVTLGEGSTMEDVIKDCAAVAYFAGADTVSKNMVEAETLGLILN
ncbi:hypothetical protein PQX77_008114 [Marasmius sp. AFHP31]|nr:hypothetical protein PQX77_008114 [Marasmius sp. AFHP31]